MWLGGNVLGCDAGIHGFESALGHDIALFSLSFFFVFFFLFFSEKFLSIYAGVIANLFRRENVPGEHIR